MSTAPNYILYAIPVFFLLIAVEILVARHQRKPYYRFNDSINDLSMGVAQQLAAVFFRFVPFAFFGWIYENVRLLTLPSDHPATWIFAFFFYDLCYYWAHRKSHEINLLWGGHAPHHQSEEYNLAVALRQGAFQGPLLAPFYWPLALLGVHPLVFLTVGQLNTIYQFWIHTRLIGRTGFLETFLNTPSHHRVHHGKNPQYIDRNHAGMFIIWDKLFGTFVPEKEEPVYGIIDPLRSWNPLWANLQFFVTLWRAARASPNRLDLLRIWFMPAGWTPQGGKPSYRLDVQSPAFLEQYDTSVSRGVTGYVSVHFLLTLGASVATLIFQSKLSWPEIIAVISLVLASLTAFGGLMEHKRWAPLLELARLAFAAALAGYFLGPAGAIALGLLGLASLGTLFYLREDLAELPPGTPQPPILSA